MILTRPFPRENLDLMWGWLCAWQRSTLDQMAPQNLRELRDKYDRDVAAGSESFAVRHEAFAEPVGVCWFDNLGTGIYMGHAAFEDKALTPREKREAMSSALDQIFELGARKVSWVAYRDNYLFLRFLRGLGAKQEGQLQCHVARGDKYIDAVVLASFPREATA
jgi:RimJ/RimL family protein N-acetyltransferase